MKKFLKVTTAVLCLAGILAAGHFVGVDIVRSTKSSAQGPILPPFDESKLWDGSVDTSWFDPENIQKEYEIENAAQLAGLSAIVSSGQTFENIKVKLVDNIFLNNPTKMFENGEFVEGDYLHFNSIGIGKPSVKYMGIFDGQNYSINGLYQNDPKSFYGGLFNQANEATIENIVLNDCYVTGSNAGALVGSGEKNTIINNVHIKNAWVFGGGVGGIMGRSSAFNEPMTITNSTFSGRVVSTSSSGNIGGVLGFSNYSALTIDNVDIDASLEGSYSIGGIVGFSQSMEKDVSISNCDVHVDICGTAVFNNMRSYYTSGGGAGYSGIGVFLFSNDSTKVKIENCNVTGNINGYGYDVDKIIVKDYLCNSQYAENIQASNLKANVSLNIFYNECQKHEGLALPNYLLKHLQNQGKIAANVDCVHFSNIEGLGDSVSVDPGFGFDNTEGQSYEFTATLYTADGSEQKTFTGVAHVGATDLMAVLESIFNFNFNEQLAN